MAGWQDVLSSPEFSKYQKSALNTVFWGNAALLSVVSVNNCKAPSLYFQIDSCCAFSLLDYITCGMQIKDTTDDPSVISVP